MINTTIEERIFYFRTRNNWSQSQLGDAIEKESGKLVSKDVISNYEKGRRKVPSELVPVLARIFDISTDELFYKPGEESHSDDIGSTIMNARHIAAEDKAAAFDITFEALGKAKEEIQKLKIQVAESMQETATYKVELEKYKAVVDRVKKATLMD